MICPRADSPEVAVLQPKAFSHNPIRALANLGASSVLIAGDRLTTIHLSA